MNILLNWIKPHLNFSIEFSGKKGYRIIFWIEYSWKKTDIGKSFELNFIAKWMNESYFESIFAIFDEKSSFFCLFWTLFGLIFWLLFLFDQYQWFPDYWIELSFELNQQNFLWIEWYFELNLGLSNIELKMISFPQTKSLSKILKFQGGPYIWAGSNASPTTS